MITNIFFHLAPGRRAFSQRRKSICPEQPISFSSNMRTKATNLSRSSCTLILIPCKSLTPERLKGFLVQCLLFIACLFCCSTSIADELDDTYKEFLVFTNRGKPREALPFAERAVTLAAMKFGAQNKSTARYMVDLGDVYKACANFPKAEEFYRRALEIDPGNPAYLHNVGLLFKLLSEYRKAEPFYTRALQESELQNGRHHPVTAMHLLGLGDLYIKLGDNAKARQLLARSLEWHRKHFGSNHPRTKYNRELLDNASE